MWGKPKNNDSNAQIVYTPAKEAGLIPVGLENIDAEFCGVDCWFNRYLEKEMITFGCNCI